MSHEDANKPNTKVQVQPRGFDRGHNKRVPAKRYQNLQAATKKAFFSYFFKQISSINNNDFLSSLLVPFQFKSS